MKKMLLALIVPFIFIGCNSDESGFIDMFPEDGICFNGNCTDGVDGKDGQPGLSAYVIWLNNGNSGTEEEFIASLVGEDGLSAYEIAVENGYEGTVEEWLQSLVGPQGPQGLAGADGKDGICPDCDGNGTVVPLCPPDINDTEIHLIFYFKRGDLSDYQLQHYIVDGINPALALNRSPAFKRVGSPSDGNFTQEDRSGTVILRGSMPLEFLEEGTLKHGLGIQFLQEAQAGIGDGEE